MTQPEQVGEHFSEKYFFIGSFEVLGDLVAFSQYKDIHILKQICKVPGFQQFSINWPHRDTEDPQCKWVPGPMVGWLKYRECRLFAAICSEYPYTELYVRALSSPYRESHQIQNRQRVAVVIPVKCKAQSEFLHVLLKKHKYFFQILDSCPWYIQ